MSRTNPAINNDSGICVNSLNSFIDPATVSIQSCSKKNIYIYWVITAKIE